MSDFHKFALAVHVRYNEMAKQELFEVDITPDEIWATYLAAFPEGTNPVFRTNTEHDCSCCRNFIKNLGRVIAIDASGERQTVWGEWAFLPAPYDTVGQALSTLVLNAKIKSVYRTKERSYGAEQSRELRADGSVHVWKHFHGKVENKHHSFDADTVRGKMSTTAQVFQRGLEELRPSDVQQVIDLIEAKALYRGEEHKPALVEFKKLQDKFLADGDADFVWANIMSPAARFRNTVIGTLVQDLSADVPIEQAVRSFEAKVAPANYKRPTALITPRMIDDAMKELECLDLQDSLRRRFAKISDVSVNNVLWVDNSVKSQMKDGLADMLKASIKPTKADMSRAEDISIHDFMANVLPRATSIELLVKNAHAGNFVSLTAPEDERAASMFKWPNKFAWSYDGNVTDSIRERVKNAGGNVDGKLRFSLAWNNTDDLDLHVYTPNGSRIYFGNRSAQGGRLDVDANGQDGMRSDPVENVAFQSPTDGIYVVKVHQWSKRQNHDVGFTLQAATEGQVMEFSHPAAVGPGALITVGTFTVKGGQIVNVTDTDPKVEAGSTPKEKWGIKTESLVKVQTVMFSPNHWDDHAIGNKHWFFILEGCKADLPARGIYNEFLLPEFEKHRKVFEVLGDKTKCPVVDEQLSGLGFSSTKQDSVTVQVKGDKLNKQHRIIF